ncbi:DUF2341 domain-containing protein [Thermococcus sp. GR6]|uniref:DUF2341 domain-containing protein n=1 Tax=Thermococcus sp. GR6 TaxID=1638256 RepID=UPI001431B5C9|nr:DUF2341 domain-containing protein [Thermococcus sp. GR6]NJE42868.1 DUF2341 domain-containing protein [Thermococcus sp. GR6]
MRKRRAFLINSTVILLLIPLMLLLATYEDISSQIVLSQSERIQIEKTYRIVSYIEMDFQRTLEISGKRAVVTVVDYIASTGNFLDPNSTPANVTMRDLILSEEADGIDRRYSGKLMSDQTVFRWLVNISSELRKQGYTLEIENTTIPDIVNMDKNVRKDFLVRNIEMTVAPLDPFRIVIRAKMKNVKISDMSNKVVYQGPIPREGYVYSIVSIEELEDPMFSALTGGRYFRSIRACEYPYPELIDRPIKVVYGNGTSESDHFAGIYSQTLNQGYIFFGNMYPGDGASAYVLQKGTLNMTDEPLVVNTSLTPDGFQVSPASVFNIGDLGVLVFTNVSSGGGGSTNWCSLLGHRVNLTVENNVGLDLTDYSIPLLISTAKGFTVQILDYIFGNTATAGNGDPYRTNASITIYDSNCNPIPFWIEYWDANGKKALIWIRASIPRNGNLQIQLYFGNEIEPTKGNGSTVFEYFAEGITIDGGNERAYLLTPNPLNIDGGFAVRFRMRANENYGDWDSGIGVVDTDGRLLLFTDDTLESGDGLAIHRPWWYYLSTVSARYPINIYHVYEALMKPYSSSQKDSKFNDITDGRVNNDNYIRTWTDPLRYVYLVTDSEKTNRRTIYDWVAVRKYTVSNDLLEDPNFNGITFYWKTTSFNELIETKPLVGAGFTKTPTKAKAYDLQPFVECVMDQKYFGAYNGWSFFERLENSDENHEEYFELAKKMQDALGIKYGNEYYPIGLVSFMVPYRTYDEKLFNIFTTLQIIPEEGISSVDYNFLNYYFNNRLVITNPAYRVWGISYIDPANPNLLLGNPLEVPFFIDENTAIAIFGEEGAQDLLKR